MKDERQTFQKCILSIGHQGMNPLVANRNLIILESMRKGPTSHFINGRSKCFLDEIMASNARFKCSLLWHDAHFVKYVPI